VMEASKEGAWAVELANGGAEKRSPLRKAHDSRGQVMRAVEVPVEEQEGHSSHCDRGRWRIWCSTLVYETGIF